MRIFVALLATLLTTTASAGAERIAYTIGFDPSLATAPEVAEALEKRTAAVGLYPSLVLSAPDAPVVIELDQDENSALLDAMMSWPGRLSFHRAAPSDGPDPCNGAPPKGLGCYRGLAPGAPDIAVIEPAAMSGVLLSAASADMDMTGAPVINLDLTPEAAKGFCALTSQSIGEKVAIIVDDRAWSAPVVLEPICFGKAMVSGNFLPEETRYLAAIIANPLPAADIGVIDAVKAPTTRQRRRRRSN